MERRFGGWHGGKKKTGRYWKEAASIAQEHQQRHRYCPLTIWGLSAFGAFWHGPGNRQITFGILHVYIPRKQYMQVCLSPGRTDFRQALHSSMQKTSAAYYLLWNPRVAEGSKAAFLDWASIVSHVGIVFEGATSGLQRGGGVSSVLSFHTEGAGVMQELWNSCPFFRVYISLFFKRKSDFFSPKSNLFPGFKFFGNYFQ